MQAPPQRSHAASRLWDGFLADEGLPLTPEELQPFASKRILITGAGGYLGSALARALGQLPIARLVLLDIAEYGLYRLEQDLRAAGRIPEAALVVGSIGDAALLAELFAEYAPQIILHAAALKHVPLMESNALAAAETNVLGTYALVEAALRSNIESLTLLSTDKAVEPISIMGATKRVAEQIVLSAGSPGNFNVLRLCNVLGSTGSVAPLFARQIALGADVTVTHPDATRYFISQTAAVRRLLRSASGAAKTRLSVPVVGRPSRIVDLANHMIRQAHLAHGPARIVYTGLRPSDKLHEQLMAASETSEPLTDDACTLAVRSSFDPLQLDRALSQIRSAVAARDRVQLIRAIQSAVPEYRGPSDQCAQAVGESL